MNNPPVVYRRNGQNGTEFQTAPEDQNQDQAIKNGFYAKINKPKPEQCSSLNETHQDDYHTLVNANL